MCNDECNFGEFGFDSFVEYDGEKLVEKNCSFVIMFEEGIDFMSIRNLWFVFVIYRLFFYVDFVKGVVVVVGMMRFVSFF